MKALILAGGRGTRLRPLTVYTPKPVVPVVNRPFLLFQIDILRRAGISDITLSLSYQPGKIEDVLGDGTEYGVSLTYVTEPNPMGTGGAYKYAAGESKEPIIVFNGDILTDLDVARMVAHHGESKAAATIALTPVDDPSRYGLVVTNDRGAVERFLEKPKAEDLASLPTNMINAGIYILDAKILDLIPEGENYSFEYNVFPAILEKDLPFSSFSLADAYWRDIGTPESYLEAHLDFIGGRITGFEAISSGDAEIATSAEIDGRSVIGEGCVIKPGAQVINSVLGPGVHVDEKAVIESSVLWAHSRISSSAQIERSILGRGCHVGRNVTVRTGSVLGDKASLPDYSRV